MFWCLTISFSINYFRQNTFFVLYLPALNPLCSTSSRLLYSFSIGPLRIPSYIISIYYQYSCHRNLQLLFEFLQEFCLLMEEIYIIFHWFGTRYSFKHWLIMLLNILYSFSLPSFEILAHTLSRKYILFLLRDTIALSISFFPMLTSIQMYDFIIYFVFRSLLH